MVSTHCTAVVVCLFVCLFVFVADVFSYTNRLYVVTRIQTTTIHILYCKVYYVLLYYLLYLLLLMIYLKYLDELPRVPNTLSCLSFVAVRFRFCTNWHTPSPVRETWHQNAPRGKITIFIVVFGASSISDFRVALFQSESWCKAFHVKISFIHTQILVHLHVKQFHLKSFD